MVKLKQHVTGTITILEVYTFEGERVGHGYFLFSNYYGLGVPVLSNDEGEMLPPDFYQLRPMKVHPTIWNDTEH